MRTGTFFCMAAVLLTGLLVGCGAAQGSVPVTVSDPSCAVSDESPQGDAQKNSAAALLPGLSATGQGTVYVDVTDEMYADGRYGALPSPEDCLSAAQAADLAAAYANAFVGDEAEGAIWKLHMATGEIIAPGQTLWMCFLAPPAWSQHPPALPKDPALQALLRDYLPDLEKSGADNELVFRLDAKTGALVLGERSLPSLALPDLIYLNSYPDDQLQAFIAAKGEWETSEEGRQAAWDGFARITGAPPASLEQSAQGLDFIATNEAGVRFSVSPSYETHLLAYFHQLA